LGGFKLWISIYNKELNLFKNFLNFAFQFYHLNEYFLLVKDPRIKFQIPLNDIFSVLFLTPVFDLSAFLQIDQFLNLNINRKFKTTISDSHIPWFLSKIKSKELEKILFKVFKQIDKSLCPFKGLKLGAIDGTLMSGYYVSAFQFLSEEVPYVLSIQRYAKRDEEINASRNLMMKLVKELGEGFIDLIVVDALYKIKMMKFFKRLGMKTLVKTTENRLEIVKELEGFIRIKADNVKIYEGIDYKRLEKYKIYEMGYEWGGEKVNIAKVEEKKIKKRKEKSKGKKKEQEKSSEESYWIITNETRLKGEDMKKIAKRRWGIENNGFKGLNEFGKIKRRWTGKWVVAENFLLMVFLSYALVNLFEELFNKECGELIEEEYGKVVKNFKFFVKCMLARLTFKFEDTS